MPKALSDGFPRASGDDPTPGRERITLPEFPPRQRG